MLHAFYLKHTKHINISPGDTAEPPFTIKTIVHQTGPRILLSVTHMLYVNQVCYDVDRCVKDGSCSSSSRIETQWTVLMAYLTIWTNVDAIKHILEVATPTARSLSGRGCHALTWRSHGHSLAAYLWRHLRQTVLLPGKCTVWRALTG